MTIQSNTLRLSCFAQNYLYAYTTSEEAHRRLLVIFFPEPVILKTTPTPPVSQENLGTAYAWISSYTYRNSKLLKKDTSWSVLFSKPKQFCYHIPLDISLQTEKQNPSSAEEYITIN